jgi:hypothetical protein
MSQKKPITERIFEFLRGSPQGDFEGLVARYPEFTWNEFYLEVTRGVGIFTIQETPAVP